MRQESICFTGHLTPEKCKEIVEQLERDKDDRLSDLPASAVTKTAQVSIVPWVKCQSYLRQIENLVFESNAKIFRFDLFRYTPSNSVNYNVYDAASQGEYGWHSDGKKDDFRDIKLTVIVSLSTEPYEGGDLELFVNKPQAITDLRVPGTIMMFPSYIQHRVTPVTKGTRKTLSFWIEGPNFR